jgi:hypothetical protein
VLDAFAAVVLKTGVALWITPLALLSGIACALRARGRGALLWTLGATLAAAGVVLLGGLLDPSLWIGPLCLPLTSIGAGAALAIPVVTLALLATRRPERKLEAVYASSVLATWVGIGSVAVVASAAV